MHVSAHHLRATDRLRERRRCRQDSDKPPHAPVHVASPSSAADSAGSLLPQIPARLLGMAFPGASPRSRCRADSSCACRCSASSRAVAAPELSRPSSMQILNRRLQTSPAELAKQRCHQRLTPTRAAGLQAPVRQVSAGFSHAGIVTDAGDLLMLRYGVGGRLGLGGRRSWSSARCLPTPRC